MVTALGLPLLIVNGKFRSLSSMSVEDLETFIPFLSKCSVNRAGAQLINGIPEWWSSVIKYKFPLKKPNGLSQTGYRRHLSSIICSCYWYHDAQYLLPFCAKIANTPESISLRNNEDNTTSIFDVQNTCQVLKFNNENKNYDRKPKKEKCSTRSLLSALSKKPVIIPDIYLCENCDAEFVCYSDMLKHEKECCEIVIDFVKEKSNIVKVNDFVVNGIGKKKQKKFFNTVQTNLQIKPNINLSIGKNSFLNYLELQSKNNEDIRGLSKLKNSGSLGDRMLNANLYFYKGQSIEFSSPMGRKLLEQRSKKYVSCRTEHSFAVKEYYCGTNNVIRKHKESYDFRVTNKRPKKDTYMHLYTFTKAQRRNRYITLKTGLNEQSRKLLKQCKKLQIVLRRLNVRFGN